MGKILIRSANIHEIYTVGSDTIYVTENFILAPSAKDFARDNNLKVVYCNASDAKCVNSNENLKEQIERILKNDFGIVNSKVVDNVMKKLGW